MTSDLITRLSKLEGPDREVDANIWKTIDVDHFAGAETTAKMRSTMKYLSAPYYTESMDDAATFARRLWPNCTFQIEDHPEQSRVGIALNRYDGDLNHAEATAAKTPLALCIAILKAKEAEECNRWPLGLMT